MKEEMQPVVEVLTSKMQQLMHARASMKDHNDALKPLRAGCKKIQDDILALMVDHGIDKANFEELECCATIATSKRKRGITSSSITDLLAKHIPQTEAEELVSKMKSDISESAEPVKFVRFTKK